MPRRVTWSETGTKRDSGCVRRVWRNHYGPIQANPRETGSVPIMLSARWYPYCALLCVTVESGMSSRNEISDYSTLTICILGGGGASLRD